MHGQCKSIFGTALTIILICGASSTITAVKADDQPAAESPSSPGAALVRSGSIPLNSNTVADIASAAAPAVVNIEVDHPIQAANFQQFGLPFAFPFGEFFNGQIPQGQGLPGQGQGQGQGQAPKIEQHGNGSGFIVRPDGYILTNAHVVKGADTIKVTLNDKRSFKGTVVGTDGFSDLAAVKIDAKDLPTLKMGASKDLRPGEFVVAIGSPHGLDHTVTLGIVSAVERAVQDINGNINFIQTDAAINPGNSGGPLLNLAGEVVGINTAIMPHWQNIGFAIPVDIAKNVAAELVEHQRVDRPWLGVLMETVDENIAKSEGVPPGTHGVLIKKVLKQSPALQSGLQSGDIIEKIDGQDMKDNKAVQDYVRAHKVQDTLHMLVLHKGEVKALPVKIGQYPEEPVTVRDLRGED